MVNPATALFHNGHLTVRIRAGEAGVEAVEFVPPDTMPEPGPAHPLTREAARQLKAYFAGTLWRFDLPLSPAGTPFQLRVWNELVGIPYGETCSYGQLADRIGSPTAVRAVGAANGANPIAIVVPCHRVIGSNGKLTGYGGGLPLKQVLLELEAKYAWRSRKASIG
jgi:methylated-DNA-[protein]-cysteine S-methyltransferase